MTIHFDKSIIVVSSDVSKISFLPVLFVIVEDQVYAGDQITIKYGATWEDFEEALELRGENSAPRICFDESVLEIMSPGRVHEKAKSNIGRLLETFCQENHIEFQAIGSLTVRNKKKTKGAEPDECYIFSKEAISFFESKSEEDQSGTPELAIEVVWTSSRIDKLNIYRDIGVKEVWYWIRGRISIYVLEDGYYQKKEKSSVLPNIDITELLSFANDMSTSVGIQKYRLALKSRK
jgi:Uma2 family endonuclease